MGWVLLLAAAGAYLYYANYGFPTKILQSANIAQGLTGMRSVQGPKGASNMGYFRPNTNSDYDYLTRRQSEPGPSM
jgi:hypothetical protein